MIGALEALEHWIRRLRLPGRIACLFIGHPVPRWGGPGWISTSRACPRCGGSQFYIADPEAHAAELHRLGQFSDR